VGRLKLPLAVAPKLLHEDGKHPTKPDIQAQASQANWYSDWPEGKLLPDTAAI
jgi:hypothetical protein